MVVLSERLSETEVFGQKSEHRFGRSVVRQLVGRSRERVYDLTYQKATQTSSLVSNVEV